MTAPEESRTAPPRLAVVYWAESVPLTKTQSRSKRRIESPYPNLESYERCYRRPAHRSRPAPSDGTVKVTFGTWIGGRDGAPGRFEVCSNGTLEGRYGQISDTQKSAYGSRYPGGSGRAGAAQPE